MKITSNDQQHLTVHSSPISMWWKAFGFVAIAVIVLLFFGKQSTLTCNRAERICNLEKKTLLKTTTLPIPLEQLVSAEVYTSTEIEGSEIYRVWLNTTKGSVPLSSYSWISYNSHRRTADKINAFISTPTLPSLEVKQDNRILLYIISVVFAVIGLLMFGLSRRVTLDLDRTKDLATLKRANLITSSIDEIQLSNLAQAEVESSREQNGMTYRVTLVQHAGKRIPLVRSFSAGKKGKQKLAEKINNFLQG